MNCIEHKQRSQSKNLALANEQIWTIVYIKPKRIPGYHEEN